MTRNHHHRHVRIVGLDLIEQLQAVDTAALQPNIKEDQLRTPLGDGLESLVAVTGRPGAMPLVLKNARHEVANIGLVVNDQNVGRHCFLRIRSAAERPSPCPGRFGSNINVTRSEALSIVNYRQSTRSVRIGRQADPDHRSMTAIGDGR